MTTIIDPTHDQLNNLMDFGHVVQVWHTGTHTYLSDDHDRGHSWPNSKPEECVAIYDPDNQGDPGDAQLKEDVERFGWSLVTGYTGQYGYRGAAMHDSEFIGGGLAKAILETEGFYVTGYIDWYDEGDHKEDPHTEGWFVAYFGDGIV